MKLQGQGALSLARQGSYRILLRPEQFSAFCVLCVLWPALELKRPANEDRVGELHQCPIFRQFH